MPGAGRGWLFAAPLLLVILGGCPSSVTPIPADDRPLATLADRPITVDAALRALRASLTPGQIPRSGDGFEGARGRLLNELFVEEVLLLEARARGLKVPADALHAELAARLGDPPNPDAHAAATARLGSVEAFEELVRRRLLSRSVEAELREELGKGVEVTPEQIASAQERFKRALMKPARVRARQIFSPDPTVARALHARIAGGETFVAVAQSATGSDGDMGWMDTDNAPSLLLEATAGLAPGQSTEVLRSPLGYHVFQLVARRPALEIDGEAAAGQVEAQLRGDAVQARLEAWIAAKTEALGLVVHEDVLEGLRCCREGDVYVVLPEEAR